MAGKNHEAGSKRPAFQLYVRDLRGDPQLSRCTPATRGIWVDAFSAIEEQVQSSGGEPFLHGSCEALGRICRCTTDEMVHAAIELAITRTADVLLNRRPFPPGEASRIQIAVAEYLVEQLDGQGNGEPRKVPRDGAKAVGNPVENLWRDASVTPLSRLSNALLTPFLEGQVTLISRRVYRKHAQHWRARNRQARWRSRKE